MGSLHWVRTYLYTIIYINKQIHNKHENSYIYMNMASFARVSNLLKCVQSTYSLIA